MAELTARHDGDAAPGAVATPATEAALRARIAELEALVDARTQAVVAMGARLAELERGAPPPAGDRLRAVERELADLRATKVVRWSALPRRLYGRLRAVSAGRS